jgi:hypothetical protein
MTIKKVFKNIEIVINILGKTTEINDETIMEDICISFSDVICLNKNEEFNSLIKKQQQTTKYILVPNPKAFDELRILLKMLNNFLLVTKQFTNFSIETITIIGEKEITAHGSEMYLGSISDISFSPTSRSHWTSPQTMYNIIALG